MVLIKPLSHEWVVCPRDGSFLVPLGSMGAAPDLCGVAEFYCPRCDEAFLVITELRGPDVSGKYNSEWTDNYSWSRAGTVFRFNEMSPPSCFGNRQWEVRIRNLRFHVQGFLKEREKLELLCPPCLEDGCPSISLGLLRDKEGRSYKLGWCTHCQLVSTYTHDIDYGWEGIALFVWEDNCRFRLRAVIRRRGAGFIDNRSLFQLAHQIPLPYFT